MKRMLTLATCGILLAGCGQMEADFGPRSPAREPQASFDTTLERQPKPVSLADDNVAGGEHSGGPGESAVDRKIIYTATMSIVVESFDEVETTINRLVKTHHGYIANFNENRSQGANRAATWVLRVPVGGFNEVLDAVADLGVPESRTVDSEDVSEQFVDLEAQLKNRRRLETEMLELLEKRDGDLKDILTIKHELASVREEIERIEGRLRFLTDRVELTTITINVRQEVDYVPAQAPTFASRIEQTWNGSLATMQSAGEELVLLAVGAGPWLALALLVTAPPIWLLRRSLLRSTRNAAA